MNHWDQIRNAVRPSISDDSYRYCLQPVRLGKVDGSVLRLVAPNSTVRDWLRDEFRPTILSASQSLGMSIQSIAVDTDEPRRMHAQQELPLPAPPFNERYTFERFVVGSCNEFAHAAAQAVASAPARRYNPLYLYSDVGMGKTHLLHAIGRHVNRTRPGLNVVYVSAEEFMNEMIKCIQFNNMRFFHDRFRSADALLVDDIQILGSKERTQEEFFHTFNTLHNRNKQIVISSDSSPEAIPGLVKRLKSRFASGLMADIQAPDLETKMAILDQKAAEEKIVLPEDVRSYIATRLDTNIRELEGVLNRLIHRSYFTGSRITTGMVRTVLDSMPRRVNSRAPIEDIMRAVASEFRIEASLLKEKNNAREVAKPRQVAMYLARRLTGASLAEIGLAFRKHHSTVIYSVRKIEQDISKDSSLETTVRDLMNQLKHPTITD